MADRFDACLAFTLREEGGYVDDPADPGGATNMGITLATYRQWSDNPQLGSTQVQDMTERTATAISRSSARLAGPYRGAAQCSARDDCGRGIKISAVLTHFATMCVLYFRQLGAIVPPLISSVIS
jgi:hypothetical protein